MCVSAADGRARSISPSRSLRGGAHARGPRGCCAPGGRGGTRSGEQGHARAVCSANIPLFFPLPGMQGVDAQGLGCAFFFPLPLGRKRKKNAPVQSFLRLPARGSEDNITYVIYMHIKSLAGVCECRKILCEEEEEKKAAQSGRARREAPRCDSQKTRSSWWKCACTWPGRVSLLLGRAWAARGEAAVPGGRHRGRLALLAQNGLQCSLLTCP